MLEENHTSRVYFPKWALLLIGVFIGAVAILAVRFFTYNPPVVHYHANFAVYVNGQREEFKSSKYYEEVAAVGCSLNPVDSPLERAHMHDEINDVVHVHGSLVTWGNFFENIGWGVGDNYLQTDTILLQADDTDKLTFILNGKTVDSIRGLIIGDEDRLLVSYGNEDNVRLQKQFDSVPSTAHEVDAAKDPASCSAGTKTITLQDRLEHLF
jgi:hypothetical protein